MRRLLWTASVLLFACNSPDRSPPETTSKPTASARASATTAAAAAPTSATSAQPKIARPLYYERAIDDSDLDKRTLRELSLLRNTIYARVGNRFRRPWLHAHFSQFDWYAPKDEMDESKISKLDRSNARRVAEHDAALTQEDLQAMRDEVLARKKAKEARPEDQVELSLLSQRLGTYMGDKGKTAHPLEDHTQLDRVITLEELSTLSRRDLRILRNSVYARRGRAFASKVVRSYFETAAWYKPDNNYSDSRLTSTDQKNVQIIMSVEDSLGGPLHENPNYGKDGWFVMA